MYFGTYPIPNIPLHRSIVVAVDQCANGYGWTATAPSPALGCYLLAGGGCSGVSLRKPHTTRKDDFPDGYTYPPHLMPRDPDPQGSSRVDMLTHPHTTADCVAGVVTVTAGMDSWGCCRYHGN